MDRKPKVTIAIPNCNRERFIRQAVLSALNQTYRDLEVVVVDNASTDRSLDEIADLRGDPRLQIVRNSSNIGMTRNHYKGVEEARGEYVTLLSSDDQLHPECVEKKAAFLDSFPRVGLVTSPRVLIDANNSIIGTYSFSDRDAIIPGLDAIRWYCRSQCNVVGEPTAVMFRRNLYRTYGVAFGKQYEIGDLVTWLDLLTRSDLGHIASPLCYYRQHSLMQSNADGQQLEFSVEMAEITRAYMAHGYLPDPVDQEATGNSVRRRLSQHLALPEVENRTSPLVRRYWEMVRFWQHYQAPQATAPTEASEPRGERILVIGPDLPAYDRAAGSLRLYQMLRILVAQGHSVTYLAQNGIRQTVYERALLALGITVYPCDPEYEPSYRLPGSAKALDWEKILHLGRFDSAIFEFWYAALPYLPIIRRISPKTRILIDTVDVHFVRESREAELLDDDELRTRAAQRKLGELSAYQEADGLIVVTEEDRQVLLREGLGQPIETIPTIHDLAACAGDWQTRTGLLFVGGFGHRPNVDAVIYFCSDVLPLIRRQLPDIKVTIVGPQAPPTVQQLADDCVTIAGYVPDTAPYLNSHRVSIAPLRYGAGIKGKVSEALAAGLPVVATSIASEGMGLVAGENALLADTPEAFAEAVVRLYNDRELWQQLSGKGRELIRERYSPDAVATALARLLNLPPELKGDISVPVVDIVLPVGNSLRATRQCFAAIRRNTPEGRYRIILVAHRASRVAEFLAQQSCEGEIEVIETDEAESFSRACNRGASRATADYVLFLRDDCVPQLGWLEALRGVIKSDLGVGAVGSKLLFLDGRIQHAGFVIVEDSDTSGSLAARPTYRGLPGAYHEANEARVYQALSAACLLVRRSVFEGIGGFGEACDDGGEDLDLCLKIGGKGYQIVYQPSSVVIRAESKADNRVLAGVDRQGTRLSEQWLGRVQPDAVVKDSGLAQKMHGTSIRPYTRPDTVHNPYAWHAELPQVSIIIPVYNAWSYTVACLRSIARHTHIPHEVIVVDNGSTDETSANLLDMLAGAPSLKVIRNASNLGYAAANNQGLALASGEYLLLLNNDTLVTAGYLERMLAVFKHEPPAGFVGPMSNRVSGPQLVSNATYWTATDLDRYASWRAVQHAGQSAASQRLVGFCMLLRRSLIDALGGLDERFQNGNFEDDDYCIRSGLLGYEGRIALDAFVHHAGGSTFKTAGMDYRAHILRNWQLFKQKWSIPLDTPIEQGYSVDPKTLPPTSMYVPLPNLRNTHRLDQSGRWWEEHHCVEVTPNDREPHALLAESLMKPGLQALEQNDIQGAAQAFSQVTQDYPELAAAHTALGSTLMALGLHTKAVESLRRALALAPTADLYNQLGVALYQSEDVRAAETAFRSASRDGGHAGAMLNLIDLYRAQEDYQQETAVIKQAVAAYPDNPEVFVAMARTSLELGMLDAARLALDRIKQLAPDHEAAPVIEEILAAKAVETL